MASAPAAPRGASGGGAGGVCESRDGLVVLQVGTAQVEAVADGFAAPEALVCVRPEDVVLFPARVDGAGRARNHLRGVVRRVTPAGAEARVEVDCGFKLIASITRRSLDDLGL